MFGPPVFGAVSDYCTRQAAIEANVGLDTLEGPELAKRSNPTKRPECAARCICSPP